MNSFQMITLEKEIQLAFSKTTHRFWLRLLFLLGKFSHSSFYIKKKTSKFVFCFNFFLCFMRIYVIYLAFVDINCFVFIQFWCWKGLCTAYVLKGSKQSICFDSLQLHVVCVCRGRYGVCAPARSNTSTSYGKVHIGTLFSHYRFVDVVNCHSNLCCSWDDLKVFERAKRNGKLSIRIYAAVPLSTWKQLADFIAYNRVNSTYSSSLAVLCVFNILCEEIKFQTTLQFVDTSEWGSDGRGDEWLRIGNLKGFVDGSLGSHTALMFEPYNDTANYTGLVRENFNVTLSRDNNWKNSKREWEWVRLRIDFSEFC